MPQARSIPAISDAEWDVMKVVWDHGPLTSGDVVKRLADEKDWKPRTVKTLLSRLVQKGAVAPALVHLIQESELSQEQIRELKKVLEREARR